MIRLLLVLPVAVTCASCATQPPVVESSPAQHAEGWWAWVVPGRLIGAAAPEKAPGGPDAWLATLADAAGDAPLAVLNLRQKSYPDLADQVADALHLPIPDYTPPSRAQADAAGAFIDDQLGQGRVVVVHCHGGCGRTGTILAAWLKRRDGLSGADAISSLRQQRGCFVETPGQASFVESY
jgi:hypothetical protein